MLSQEQQQARIFDETGSGCPRKRSLPDRTMPLACTLTDDYGDWGEAMIVEKGRKKPHAINEMRVLPDVFNGQLLLSLYEGKGKLVRQLEIPFDTLRPQMDRYTKADRLAKEYEAPDTMTSKIVMDTVYDFRVASARIGRGRIDTACTENGVMLSDRMRHALFIELSKALTENHTGKAFG